MNCRISVLHVDDSLLDIELIRDTLEKEQSEFTVQSVRSKQEFEKCIGEKKYDVVLSDFNILGFDALDILKIVHEHNPDIPVIVVTGTGSEEIAVESMKRGAADYVIKHPSHILKLPKIIHAVLEKKRLLAEQQKDAEILRLARFSIDHARDAIFWIDQESRLVDVNKNTCLALEYTSEELLRMNISDIDPNLQPSVWSAQLEEIKRVGSTVIESRHRTKSGRIFPVEISINYLTYKEHEWICAIARDISERKKAEATLEKTLNNLRKAMNTTIQIMVSAVDAKDPYTAGHQNRSAKIATAIAIEMELPQEKIDGVSMAGPIHDIGKLSVPTEILSKPGKLSANEFSLIKEHARKGYEILKDVESPWPLAQIVYQHHERMNGSGYPRNLKGDDILMEARILAVADVVESMASYRPYRPALGINVALEEIEKNREALYDAEAVDACLRLFREKGFKLASA